MFKRFLALFKKKRLPEFHDPEFGLLTRRAGLWSGQAQCEGREIRFAMTGSESAPEAALLEQVRSLLKRFKEVEQGALEFICAQKRHFKPRDFTFESVTFPSAEKPGSFTMGFVMEGDDDGIWRIGFENGRPGSAERKKLK